MLLFQLDDSTGRGVARPSEGPQSAEFQSVSEGGGRGGKRIYFPPWHVSLSTDLRRLTARIVGLTRRRQLAQVCLACSPSRSTPPAVALFYFFFAVLSADLGCAAQIMAEVEAARCRVRGGGLLNTIVMNVVLEPCVCGGDVDVDRAL
jgi:hypothetical protein